jgi:hypothetical protein
LPQKKLGFQTQKGCDLLSNADFCAGCVKSLRGHFEHNPVTDMCMRQVNKIPKHDKLIETSFYQSFEVWG